MLHKFFTNFTYLSTYFEIIRMRRSGQLGFSLIEAIIYIAIVGVMISYFLSFGISISKSHSKVYVAQEVQSNMRTAIEIMSERIRGAQSVDTGASTFDSDPGVLTLVMNVASEDPTVFELNADDGALTMSEDGAAGIIIAGDANNTVKVTKLMFADQTGSSPHEIIGIDIIMEYNTTAGDGTPVQYSMSAQTSVSVRQ